MLSGKCWPAHPRPHHNELLSCWLVRIAHANGMKVQTFCHQEFKGQHQIWNRDIDRLAPEWLLTNLHEKTYATLHTIEKTTLRSYKGRIIHDYKTYGHWLWTLPLQMYHRKYTGHGLQYCSQCLSEDEEPYYRKSWRLAFYTFCPKHNIMMRDRCPNCEYSVAFHRIELGKPQKREIETLANCWHCGFDYRLSKKQPVEIWSQSVFSSWTKILRMVDFDSQQSKTNDYSRLSILHHFCGLIVSRAMAPKLHRYLCEKTDQPVLELSKAKMFELRPLEERHYVIAMAWWLIGRFPHRINRAWENKIIRYNHLFKDFGFIPKKYSIFISSIRNKL